MKKKTYYLYITASISRVLYTGMTNNLYERVRQHKNGISGSAFTKRYRVDRLVYFEEYSTADEAIRREKQIKGWRREKKVQLIEQVNPAWRDLSLNWTLR